MNRPRRRTSSGRMLRAPLAPRRPAASTTATSLSRGRLALQDIQGQLTRLLQELRDPSGMIDARAPDRLRAATAEANAALALLADFRAV